MIRGSRSIARRSKLLRARWTPCSLESSCNVRGSRGTPEWTGARPHSAEQSGTPGGWGKRDCRSQAGLLRNGASGEYRCGAAFAFECGAHRQSSGERGSLPRSSATERGHVTGCADDSSSSREGAGADSPARDAFLYTALGLTALGLSARVTGNLMREVNVKQ